MRNIEFSEVVKSPYKSGAVIRNDFPGFREDYLSLHCLIKKYQPKTFLEIGTSSGDGTKVICRALGLRRFFSRKDRKVFSIDVPPGTDPKKIYPQGEDGHPRRAGRNCKLPFQQIFGNSLGFDFSAYYPIEGWFIDGKHDYQYAKNDTELALKSNPKLIIWHDMQIAGVEQAVTEVMAGQPDYELFRVLKTRIAFALRLDLLK